MPEPLNPYYKKLNPVKYTSTSWKPEPYKEYTTETEPPPQPLPNYYPKSYAAPHNPKIPYREVTTKKEYVQPYTHYFPKYTTTYYYSQGYDKESIRIGYDEPYKKEEKYEENKYEEKKYEEPKYEEPKYEEKKHEEPKYEEPKYEEKKYEEPKYEEPKYAEPKYEKPKYEEEKPEHSKYEETKYR